MAGSQLECGAHRTNYLRKNATASALNSCIVRTFVMTDRLCMENCALWNYRNETVAVFPLILCYQLIYIAVLKTRPSPIPILLASFFVSGELLIETRSDKRQTTDDRRQKGSRIPVMLTVI